MSDGLAAFLISPTPTQKSDQENRTPEQEIRHCQDCQHSNSMNAFFVYFLPDERDFTR